MDINTNRVNLWELAFRSESDTSRLLKVDVFGNIGRRLPNIPEGRGYREDQCSRPLPCDINTEGKGKIVLLNYAVSSPIILDISEMGSLDEPLVFDYRAAAVVLPVYRYWHLVERDLELNRTVLLPIDSDVLAMLQQTDRRANKVFTLRQPFDRDISLDLFSGVAYYVKHWGNAALIFHKMFSCMEEERKLLKEYSYDDTSLQCGAFLEWVEDYNGIKESEDRCYIDGAVFY